MKALEKLGSRRIEDGTFSAKALEGIKALRDDLDQTKSALHTSLKNYNAQQNRLDSLSTRNTELSKQVATIEDRERECAVGDMPRRPPSHIRTCYAAARSTGRLIPAGFRAILSARITGRSAPTSRRAASRRAPISPWGGTVGVN